MEVVAAKILASAQGLEFLALKHPTLSLLSGLGV